MEEENRKARRAARREYNEEVQELVAFVRKRDKRVAKYQVGGVGEEAGQARGQLPGGGRW